MRQKKHRKVSRTVRFLKIAFKFREPFKVLEETTFATIERACIGQNSMTKRMCTCPPGGRLRETPGLSHPWHAGRARWQFRARIDANSVRRVSSPPSQDRLHVRKPHILACHVPPSAQPVKQTGGFPRRTDPMEAVPKLLGGVCKLYTSSCILEELRSLGPAFEGRV